MNLARQAIEYKNKCLQIVQRYIDATEESFTDKELLEDCRYITRAHFEDLIEERACADICGYVRCDNVLSSKSRGRFKPTQTYHIRNNKVYNITRRKNFCSDLCFMSAEYLRNQISTEPIYMRKGTTAPLHLYAEKNGLVGDEVKIDESILDCDRKNVQLKRYEKPLSKEEIVMKDKTTRTLLLNERRIEHKISSPYIKEDEFKELKDKFKELRIQEENN